MKKLPIIVSIALFFFAATSAPAQTRIQFAKGKSSATIKGTTGEYGITYVVRARSGQKLNLKLDPSTGIGIKVEKDGSYGHEVLLREEAGGSFEVGLEESGDVTVFIGSASGRSKPFTLTITITRLTDI